MSSNYFNWDGPRTILNDINNVNASAKTHDFSGRTVGQTPIPNPSQKIRATYFLSKPAHRAIFWYPNPHFFGPTGQAAHDQV